jgi:hypothetical protein
MRSALPIGLAVLATLAIAPVGCGGQQKAPAEENAPDLSIVDATVVVDSCPDAKTMNSKAAHAAINKLVAPCSKVPGGAAHFSATLVPGGRIKLAAPSGDPAEGVVPTCVLSNQLTHRVLLKQACKLDVKLEERKVGGSSAAPAPSGT